MGVSWWPFLGMWFLLVRTIKGDSGEFRLVVDCTGVDVGPAFAFVRGGSADSVEERVVVGDFSAYVAAVDRRRFFVYCYVVVVVVVSGRSARRVAALLG